MDSDVRNVLLSRIPAAVREKLLAQSRTVELCAGKRLMEPETPLDSAWFPLTGTLSMLRVFENGASVEIGMIGREGVLGVHALLQMHQQPNAALVQADGEILRVPIASLVSAFEHDVETRTLLLKYVHFMLIQGAQIAACNRLHSAEERLARWLLAMHDRIIRDELTVTQDFLSHMLATRRATINEAVRALCDSGASARKRNHVSVLDRPHLESLACECYGALAREAYRTVGFEPHPRSSVTFA